MEEFVGYFCSKCNYVISNEHSIFWRRLTNEDGTKSVVLIPYCAYHKTKVEPKFEIKVWE